MKKSICILLVCLSVSGIASAQKAKKATLTLTYTFAGIEEGYDHISKTEVYLDGNLAGTTSEKKESEGNLITVVTTKGTHSIKIVNYAFYEGVWEEHTIENEFSQDCRYEDQINLSKKKNELVLLFDIDNGTKLVN